MVKSEIESPFEYRCSKKWRDAFWVKSAHCMIEERLLGDEDITVMKKSRKKYKDLERSFEILNNYFEKNLKKINNRGTNQVLQQLSGELKATLSKLKAATGGLDRKIHDCDMYGKHLASPGKTKCGKKLYPEVQRFFDLDGARRRKQDMALSWCLYRMSNIFGGTAALFNAFKKDSELEPEHLANSYTVESLRKKIDGYKETHPELASRTNCNKNRKTLERVRR